MKKRKPLSEETKAKISNALKPPIIFNVKRSMIVLEIYGIEIYLIWLNLFAPSIIEDSIISLGTFCKAAEKITIENPELSHTIVAKAASMVVSVLPNKSTGFIGVVIPRLLNRPLIKPIKGLYINDHNKPTATIDIIWGKNSIVLETPDNIRFLVRYSSKIAKTNPTKVGIMADINAHCKVSAIEFKKFES